MEQKSKLHENEITAVHVKGVNEEVFNIGLTVENNNMEKYSLFIKQDLTDYTLIQETDESFQDFISSDQFSLYKSLFPSIDEEEKHLKYDVKNKVIDIEREYYYRLNNRCRYYLSHKK